MTRESGHDLAGFPDSRSFLELWFSQHLTKGIHFPVQLLGGWQDSISSRLLDQDSVPQMLWAGSFLQVFPVRPFCNHVMTRHLASQSKWESRRPRGCLHQKMVKKVEGIVFCHLISEAISSYFCHSVCAKTQLLGSAHTLRRDSSQAWIPGSGYQWRSCQKLTDMSKL